MKMVKPLIFIWSVIKPYKFWYIIMMIAPIGSGVFPIMYNYAVKLLIDLFAQTQQITFFQSIKPICIFVGAQVILDGGWRIHNFAQLKCKPLILSDMLNKICKHCFDLPYTFFQNNLSGSIISKIKGIGDNYVKLHESLEYQLSKPILITIFSGVILSITNFKIFVFIVFFTFIYSPVAFKIFSKISKMEGALQNSWHHLFGNVSDSISNIFTIFSFATKQKELIKIKDYYNNIHNPMAFKYYKYDFITSIILSLFYWVFIIVLFCYTIYLRNNNEISVGDIAYVMSLAFLFLENSWVSTMEVKHFLERMASFLSSFSIMEVAISDIDKIDSKTLKALHGEIIFKNICFGYEKDQVVFNNFNLHIKAGEKIGIIGTSGSGKSTLISLLLKNFKTHSGDIIIDGTSIYDCTSDSLRANISLIPQDIMLFHRSIAENIGYAKENPTQDEIELAAKLANIHEFINNLPNKYDTLVGERGVKLSGGQRQRIAIARSMLKNAAIVILDEATSALDSETEVIIQNSINQMLKTNKSTLIAIAHRLSTIKHMDRIVVIDNGKIVEDGKFSELINNPEGKFKSLWNHQANGMIC